MGRRHCDGGPAQGGQGGCGRGDLGDQREDAGHGELVHTGVDAAGGALGDHHRTAVLERGPGRRLDTHVGGQTGEHHGLHRPRPELGVQDRAVEDMPPVLHDGDVTEGLQLVDHVTQRRATGARLHVGVGRLRGAVPGLDLHEDDRRTGVQNASASRTAFSRTVAVPAGSSDETGRGRSPRARTDPPSLPRLP
jgi:hypothetical protein